MLTRTQIVADSMIQAKANIADIWANGADEEEVRAALQRIEDVCHALRCRDWTDGATLEEAVEVMREMMDTGAARS